jgi:hypothetical protein
MKRMVFFITLAFLISVSIVLLPVQVYAQRNITVLNPSFEKPDSGKITGFDGKTRNPSPGGKLIDVPNWTADDTLIFDSGVEAKNASNGRYGAYLMGGDTSIYQNLTRRVFDGDMLKLTVDARQDWPATGQLFKMELYYLDNDTIAKANRVIMVSETKALTGTMTAYSISINSSAVPLAVGHKIGILLDNVSPDPNSWLDIDNVRLTNEDPTIIEVPNYSFEQPDSGKIKGWNGPGSGIGWTGCQEDIPGWTTDTVKVGDSGIESGKTATEEGTYSGFMMGGDTSIWNTTDYTILAGDEITLTVSAKNSWQATLFHLELYYIDGLGNRATLEYSDDTLAAKDAWADFSIACAANATPDCIGKKLGVLLDNVSRSDSWADFDFVRINANHSVTYVSGMQMKPTVFSLAQNYPNPFNPSTNISYTLKNSSKVRLSVYDLLGREVAVLANEIQAAGTHKVTFLANGLSSGMYFYKLQTAGMTMTKKMVLMK